MLRIMQLPHHSMNAIVQATLNACVGNPIILIAKVVNITLTASIVKVPPFVVLAAIHSRPRVADTQLPALPRNGLICNGSNTSVGPSAPN